MSVTNFRRASFKKGLPKTSKFADIPAPIPAPPIVTAGLVRYYNAGNSSSYPGTGTTWTDLQASGYNLTLNNGPTFTSAGAGSYFTFDGSNDNASGADTGMPNSNNARTLIIWAWRLSTADFTSVYSYGTQNFNQAISVYQTDNYSPYDQAYLVDSYGGGFGTAGAFEYAYNQWSMLAFAFSGTNYEYMFNGVSQGTGTRSSVSTTLSGTSPGLQLAAVPGVANGNMRIGKFMVYNSKLTATEVLQNYNAQKSDYGL
jgi:hypothetical protein